MKTNQSKALNDVNEIMKSIRHNIGRLHEVEKMNLFNKAFQEKCTADRVAYEKALEALSHIVEIEL